VKVSLFYLPSVGSRRERLAGLRSDLYDWTLSRRPALISRAW